jgi:hypothetical protein
MCRASFTRVEIGSFKKDLSSEMFNLPEIILWQDYINYVYCTFFFWNTQEISITIFRSSVMVLLFNFTYVNCSARTCYNANYVNSVW